MYDTILVAIDASPDSPDDSLNRTMQFAKMTGGTVHLLHVARGHIVPRDITAGAGLGITAVEDDRLSPCRRYWNTTSSSATSVPPRVTSCRMSFRSWMTLSAGRSWTWFASASRIPGTPRNSSSVVGHARTIPSIVASCSTT